MSAAVLHMLAERIAGRPPLLPPPTRPEPEPEEVEPRAFIAWITPFGGPCERIKPILATTLHEAHGIARCCARALFPNRTFTVTVRPQ